MNSRFFISKQSPFFIFVLPAVTSLFMGCSPVHFDSIPANMNAANSPDISPGMSGLGSPNADPNVAPSPSTPVTAEPPAAAPPATTEPAPTAPPVATLASSCSLSDSSTLPANFSIESALINQVSGNQTLSVRDIWQLSNVTGNVNVVASSIAAGIVNIHGTLQVIAEEVGMISGVDQDVCAKVAVFGGVVQNISGHVEIQSLGGNLSPVLLQEIHDVGSVQLDNVVVADVHDINGDVTIENGGVVTEIGNIRGNLALVNTKVLYLHDMPNGSVTLINSQVVSVDANTVSPLLQNH